MHANPITEMHGHICVVRDDLIPGGTKARAAWYLYQTRDEIVYAGSAQSYAQVALGKVSHILGKKATVFTSARAERTNETQCALSLGVSVYEIRPGYLSVAKARAAVYCKNTGAWLAPLGFDVPEVRRYLAQAAGAIEFIPDEVWVAAGSGTLTRSLQLAWPAAKHHAVLFGKDNYLGRATPHRHEVAYGKKTLIKTPFPSHPTFDAKAWELCSQFASKDRKVLFWNVAA